MHRLGATAAITTALLLLAGIVAYAVTTTDPVLPELIAAATTDLVLWMIAGNLITARPSGPGGGVDAASNDEALREEVAQLVAEELGNRQSVLSQGYAEGYVDGIARRQEGTARN